MLALSGLVPAAVAAAHAGNVAHAARDAGVVRALGLGWTGAWHTLDAITSAFFLVVPFGTRAARAELAVAAVCGLAGVLGYLIARRLLAACATAPRFGSLVAAVASLTATLSPPWQIEATAVAGSTLGAALILLPLTIVLEEVGTGFERIPLAAFAVGLACSYEPLAGAAAIVAIGIWWVASPRVRGDAGTRWTPIVLAKTVGALAVGLVPLAAGFLGRASTLALPAWAPPVLESSREHTAAASALSFVRMDVGWVGSALMVGGVGIGFAAKRSRPLAFALAAVIAVALAARALGTPCGPTHYGAPVLAGLLAAWGLAAVTMQAIVRAIAEARVPLASTSAALVVVLEVTFPVLALDDALARVEARGASAAAIWDDVALGPLPPRPVLLLSDPRLLTRLLAARATGELRGDAAIIPLADLGGALATRELAREPGLVPLWRDLLLLNAPDEFALSSLAAARPLALPFNPGWDHALARHLLPAGLVALFEPEPRGASDRQRALAAFAGDHARLLAALDPSHDPELSAQSFDLIFARALVFSAMGEREAAGAALDECRRLAPTAHRVDELGRRLAAPTRGPVETRDLGSR
jgi:hypothetical protein